MRLATVQLQNDSCAPVLVLPDGSRVAYSELLSVLGLPQNNPSPTPTWGFTALSEVVAQKQALQAYLEKPELAAPLQHTPLLPPVPQPRSFRDFYAFEQHVKTCRARRKLEMIPQWYELPVFYFSNPNSLVGHEGSVAVPSGCKELDYELELGIVIGKSGRNIPLEKAWEHVAGFTIINDFSARDIQRQEMAVGLGPAKGKDFATGVGPYLVTLDEFADRITPQGQVNLSMCARINGRELSRGNAASMYYSWPQLIAQASRDVTLYEGELIGSGTVGTGCILELGPDSSEGWLKAGDEIELEIERLGILRHRIVT